MVTNKNLRHIICSSESKSTYITVKLILLKLLPNLKIHMKKVPFIIVTKAKISYNLNRNTKN